MPLIVPSDHLGRSDLPHISVSIVAPGFLGWHTLMEAGKKRYCHQGIEDRAEAIDAVNDWRHQPEARTTGKISHLGEIDLGRECQTAHTGEDI